MYITIVNDKLISLIKTLCIYFFIEADYLTHLVSAVTTIYYTYHLYIILSSDFQVTKNCGACVFILSYNIHTNGP